MNETTTTSPPRASTWQERRDARPSPCREQLPPALRPLRLDAAANLREGAERRIEDNDGRALRLRGLEAKLANRFGQVDGRSGPRGVRDGGPMIRLGCSTVVESAANRHRLR